jgi:hypothetical protein
MALVTMIIIIVLRRKNTLHEFSWLRSATKLDNNKKELESRESESKLFQSQELNVPSFGGGTSCSPYTILPHFPQIIGMWMTREDSLLLVTRKYKIQRCTLVTGRPLYTMNLSNNNVRVNNVKKI